MNYNIEINTGNIREFGKNIEQEGNKFIILLDNFLKEIGEIDKYFNTETGKKLKLKLIELINKDKKIINEKYIAYSKVLENIANIYDETDQEINKSVQ